MLSKLKSIYKDFYQDGYDCKLIIQNHFNGNFNTDPLMQFAIRNVNHTELSKCLSKENSYLTSSRIYSNEELNEMINSNLFIKIFFHRDDFDDDIAMIVQTGNKNRLIHLDFLGNLLKRYKRLGLLNEKYIPSSIILKDEDASLESIKSILEKYYDKSLIDKLEKLKIKE